MSKLAVKRVILDGSGVTAVKFSAPSKCFLVKNFSSVEAYVAFENISLSNINETIKIPSGTAQLCATDFYEIGAEKTDTIYLIGMGEIEVQEIWK